MGARGPRPTPTPILKLRGSREADREATEPQPEQKRPRLPKWLDEEAKIVWKQVVPQLERMHVLTRIDGNALARYCQLFSRWKKAEQFIQKYGESYPLKDKDGNVKCFQQWPQVAIAHRLSLALTKIEAEFGMTPSGRSRITVPTKEPENKLLAFLNTKHA